VVVEIKVDFWLQAQTYHRSREESREAPLWVDKLRAAANRFRAWRHNGLTAFSTAIYIRLPVKMAWKKVPTASKTLPKEHATFHWHPTRLTSTAAEAQGLTRIGDGSDYRRTVKTRA
jgi:hypothetical protein